VSIDSRGGRVYRGAVKQFEARIESNRVVAPSWRELVLSWHAEAGRPLPGQFMTIRVSSRRDPLLRRPFAFSGVSSDSATVSMIYEIRGAGTAMLAELERGDQLDVLGPLGRPFPAPAAGERAILASGGAGLGPVLFLANELLADYRGAASERPLLVAGFPDAATLPELALPEMTVFCTDDGSACETGFPSDWIARNVSPRTRAHVYGCGPAGLLAALESLASSRGWASSLSAEAWMACGVGACFGCAVPRADGAGYFRVCVDGPVFDGGAVSWGGDR